MVVQALRNGCVGPRSWGVLAELYLPAWLVPARAEGGHGRFQPARPARAC